MSVNLQECLKDSLAIYDRAVAQYSPKYTCVMFSGGDDSLTALYVASVLGIKIDFILHGNTGTGLRKTTEFVRSTAQKFSATYIEATAGSAYEDYVRRKGFFGTGRDAHTFSYHVLKRGPIQAAISKNIRHGRKSINVLLLNGIRLEESENRMDNFAGKEIRPDVGVKSNIWVNIIQNWSKKECLTFLQDLDVERNPVSVKLGRSGECMCGTMQNMADRVKASEFDAEWGQWLNDLERDVVKKFPWRWGSNAMSAKRRKDMSESHILFDSEDNFMPMCVGCKSKFNNREQEK